MKTIIMTDSNSDLPLEYIRENNIVTLGVNVNFKGKEFQDDFGQTVSYKEFYDEVRKGENPSTSQIPVHPFEEVFKKYVSEGYSIIYLGFSSALSGCINSACIARNAVLEEYKDADISVIDTKSASLGEGLIVYYAVNMLKEGHSKEEIVKWVEENKLKFIHWFTVDDLNFLKRGGRVSPTAATVGTLFNIKPVLHVDDEGRLIPVIKSRGRKKALSALVDMFEEKAVNPEEQVVFISHGDCIEDAETVKEMISKKYKVKGFMINPIGPGVGSHSGPGTVALFFVGKDRSI